MIEINFKNAVWFGIILVSAGISYGMVSQKLSALESKQQLLEKAIMQDIIDFYNNNPTVTMAEGGLASLNNPEYTMLRRASDFDI